MCSRLCSFVDGQGCKIRTEYCYTCEIRMPQLLFKPITIKTICFLDESTMISSAVCLMKLSCCKKHVFTRIFDSSGLKTFFLKIITLQSNTGCYCSLYCSVYFESFDLFQTYYLIHFLNYQLSSSRNPQDLPGLQRKSYDP